MPERQEPVWIETELALAIHDRQLAEHGGPIGLRDATALDSALARARNQWNYGDTDLCALAAAYAFGLARNHPFVDGNKRTAWVLARLFLALNDQSIDYDPADVVQLVLNLAAGTIGEADLSIWFRDRLRS